MIDRVKLNPLSRTAIPKEATHGGGQSQRRAILVCNPHAPFSLGTLLQINLCDIIHLFLLELIDSD